MIVEFKDYIIEIYNDLSYTLNSMDNIVAYQFEYFDGQAEEDRVQPTVKHGIRVSKNGAEISSAIIAEIGGATTIHDKSCIIKNQSLFICCCNRIYSLTLPHSLKNWSQELDWATCFGIYEFEDDLIINGEIEITRMDENANIKWQFSGRDIFVTHDGGNSFKIEGNEIIVSDWEGYQYRLNGAGKVIEEFRNL